MNAPFVTQFRVGSDRIVLGDDGEPRITVRVQMPEVWNAVRIDLPPATPMLELKERALVALRPEDADDPDRFIVKLHGFEVLDEHASVVEAGGVDGSIFLMTYRRRRPIRG